MATLFSEDFEAGSAGATLTTASTAFDLIQGAPTFTSSATIGNRAMSAVTTTAGSHYGRIPLGARTTIALRAYFYRTTNATTSEIVRVLTGTSTLALMRWYTSGNFGMVINGSLVGTGIGAIPINTWARVEWLITNTAMQLRLFTGANLNGTTPDVQTAVITWAPAGTISSLHVGIVSGVANTDLTTDAVAVDDTTWVGPAHTPPANTPHWYYDTGTAWADVTGAVHHDNGTAWTAL